MDMLKKWFPLSFGMKELANLIINIVIYVVIGAIGGVIIGLLSGLAVIGWLFAIIGSLIDIYVVAGIVIALLVYFKILK